EIRRADRLDLALSQQLIVRTENFLERRVLVVPVRLIEIDALDLKTRERRFNRLQDVTLAEHLVPLPHLGADFRRDDYVVMPAAPSNPTPDDRFGLAAFVAGHTARVRVRRIDEIECGCAERG